jgi:hypothetical protein
MCKVNSGSCNKQIHYQIIDYIDNFLWRQGSNLRPAVNAGQPACSLSRYRGIPAGGRSGKLSRHPSRVNFNKLFVDRTAFGMGRATQLVWARRIIGQMPADAAVKLFPSVTPAS